MRKVLLILSVLTFSFLLTTLSFASQYIGTDDRGTTISGITATGSGTDYTATATYDNEFSIADPNRTGYTFDGWTILNTATSVTMLGSKTKVDGKFAGVKDLTNIKNLSTTQDANVSIKASYTPIEYTITYDLDGGSISNQKTSYTIETESFTLPPPTKSGYTFKGWTGSNGETPQTEVTITKGSTDNKVYTANWEENPLVDLTFKYVYSPWWGNIKYGTTDEQLTEKTYKVPAGSTVKLYGKIGSQPLYLRNNASGQTSYNGTKAVPYDSRVYYNNDSSIRTTGAQFVMPSTALSLSLNDYSGSYYHVSVCSGSVTLFPIEEENIYNITYDLDGGTLDGPRTQYASEYSCTLPTPTKYGYTFTGWTGSNGETPQTTVTIPANTTGNLSYTAHWEEAPLVDLTFTDVDSSWWGNIKYGTTNEQVVRKTYKVPAGSTVKLYGKQGSQSLYLYNNASGQTSYNGTKTVAYSSTAYYNNNSSLKMKGAQFVMPSSALSLYLTYYGSCDYGVRVDSGSVVLNPLSYDTTTYNISYNLDGGSLSNPVNTYTEITNTFILPTTTKDGYTFTGWTGSNGTTPQTTVTIQQGSTGNLSYTANWEALPAVLTADSYIKADNITNFINANKNTTQQICFQGTASGKFYVKAGSFGTDSNVNPAIYNSGILIYDGPQSTGSNTSNFQCAQHLANVMNYILYNTKGSSYGTSSPIFNESIGTSKSFNESIISKGFCSASGDYNVYYCGGRGYTCFYYNCIVYSYDDDRAGWW